MLPRRPNLYNTYKYSRQRQHEKRRDTSRGFLVFRKCWIMLILRMLSRNRNTIVKVGDKPRIPISRCRITLYIQRPEKIETAHTKKVSSRYPSVWASSPRTYFRKAKRYKRKDGQVLLPSPENSSSAERGRRSKRV